MTMDDNPNSIQDDDELLYDWPLGELSDAQVERMRHDERRRHDSALKCFSLDLDRALSGIELTEAKREELRERLIAVLFYDEA